jgi:hypothetical protein
MTGQVNYENKNFQSYNQWYDYVKSEYDFLSTDRWNNFILVLELDPYDEILDGNHKCPQYNFPVKNIQLISRTECRTEGTINGLKNHLVYDIKKIKYNGINPTKSFKLYIYPEIINPSPNTSFKPYHKTRLEQN